MQLIYSASSFASREKNTASLLKTNTGQILNQAQFGITNISFLCTVLIKIGMCSQIFRRNTEKPHYHLSTGSGRTDGQPDRYTANSPISQMFWESIRKQSLVKSFLFCALSYYWPYLESLSRDNKLSNFAIDRAASYSLCLNMAILHISYSLRPNSRLLRHLHRNHFISPVIKNASFNLTWDGVLYLTAWVNNSRFTNHLRSTVLCYTPSGHIH